MPKKSNYSISDHKRAFDFYFDLQSYHGVAKELSIDVHTIRRWAGSETQCSCPWHNWEKLVAERESVLDTRLAQIEAGVFDPIAQQQAILDLDPSQVIPEERKLALRPASRVMVRSDAERLTHLEYIWSKVFYEATGIITDHSIFIDAQGGIMDDTVKEEFYKKGLSAKNLEGCVKCLRDIQESIEELRRNLGLRNNGSQGPQPASTQEKIDNENAKKELTIADLRQMRELARTTDPSKLQVLLQSVKAEEQTEETLTKTKLP